MEEKIKPCPFCGLKASAKKYYDELDGEAKILYMVKCNGYLCEAQVDGFVSKERAVLAWNKRFEDNKRVRNDAR